jgi:hypothetical protein
MKQPLKLALLLVPMLATWAFAGIYYEQEIKAPGQTTKTVWYLSGVKGRVETQSLVGASIAILRLDQGKIYQLMPDSKTYKETPITKLSPEVEAQLQVTVSKTAETKRIGDYNCTRYDITTKGMAGAPPQGVTVQWWMTTDVDVSEEYEKFTEAQCRAT